MDNDFLEIVKSLSAVTDYHIIFKSKYKVRIKVKGNECRDALVKTFMKNGYNVHSKWVDPCEYIVVVYNNKQNE